MSLPTTYDPASEPFADAIRAAILGKLPYIQKCRDIQQANYARIRISHILTMLKRKFMEQGLEFNRPKVSQVGIEIHLIDKNAPGDSIQTLKELQSLKKLRLEDIVLWLHKHRRFACQQCERRESCIEDRMFCEGLFETAVGNICELGGTTKNSLNKKE